MISLDVGYIKRLMIDIKVEVVHTYLEDFFANHAIDFAGTHRRQFSNLWETPLQAQTIIQLKGTIYQI